MIRQIKTLVLLAITTGVVLYLATNSTHSRLQKDSDEAERLSEHTPVIRSTENTIEVEKDSNSASPQIVDTVLSIDSNADQAAQEEFNLDNKETTTELITKLIDLANSDHDSFLNKLLLLDISFEDSEKISSQLLQMFENKPELFKELLRRDWSKQEYLVGLLLHPEIGISNTLSNTIDKMAIEMSYSTDNTEIARALKILAYSNGTADAIVQKRILEIGWTEDDPAIRMSVVENINANYLTPDERIEAAALLNELANASSDANLNAAVMIRLAEPNLTPDNHNLTTMASSYLNEEDAIVKSASIYALARQELTPENQAILFELAQNTKEDPIVRYSAADVLSTSSLTDYEHGLINTMLQTLRNHPSIN
jgi:hypothetical protein